MYLEKNPKGIFWTSKSPYGLRILLNERFVYVGQACGSLSTKSQITALLGSSAEDLVSKTVRGVHAVEVNGSNRR